MSFALRWCTDFSAEDPRLEGDKFRRKILKRSRSRVVYEDLDTTSIGWMWSRWTVTIRPPDRWHGTAVGNYRGWEVDYQLKPLSDGRTQFILRGRRTPLLLGAKNPPRVELERDLGKTWNKLGRALEADYRKGRRARSSRGHARRR
jgi:hypothetical protein